jgi:predicted ATPase
VNVENLAAPATERKLKMKAEGTSNVLSPLPSAAGKARKMRTAMSMARLWRDHGKRDEARELLAPVYGWFTEGFDTRDLKEAKAFLDELHSLILKGGHSSGTPALRIPS